ncbi:capsular biosynthesis protein [Celeribacter halophilus]|uniref:Capsular biosynthesis protein n=1 Tax=Celeribacter halophilus TaxID=576117 RepID=A0AAW7XYR7_9RHOB|nr:capsular biosynthesis protein [Celeribacter halophilus]MDO6458821.1 capsular biosynthesis protein [Celeribacter halophilus]MDO6722656.1 capsular biosynthesis protein [Celeribacter halophilus]
MKWASLARRYRGYKALLQHYPSASVVIWNGIKGQRSLLVHAARELGREVFYFEEAPLPKRLTIDRSGVNFGSSLPRDPAFYTAWLKACGVDPEAWRDVGRQIVPRPSDKRDDIRSENAPSELAQERFIFCPLQVPRDSQITIYGDWIKSVEEMIDHLKAASQHLPDGWHLRIKEHPSSKISFFDKLSALESDKFRVDNVTNTMDQIALSHAVLNVNSSVGLQAFFFNKPVIVLGQAFYCFDKLATKVNGLSDLADILTKPEDLTFSQNLRNAFMSYLCEDYYPMEQDVLDGTYGPEQVRQRDRDRDAILATL